MKLLSLLEIGKRIRSLRKGRYRTAKMFAEFLNISERHLSNIERGNTLPSVEILSQIAKEFHVTIDFLILGQHKRHLIDENWDALQDTFYSLSHEGRQTLNNIAKELLKLEQNTIGGNIE